jgi:manganese/zinc/iron transport system permease protein
MRNTRPASPGCRPSEWSSGLGSGWLIAAVALLCISLPAHAAGIDQLPETSLLEQAIRFFSLHDRAVRYAVAGAMLLGISCGLLGGFLVVRKLALVGDTLSHAVLPGVAAGFLWSQTKDPGAIFLGAVLAGLLGTMTVGWIQRTTRLKEDTALGLVLAGFYAVGICMVTMIQRLPTGNKSGIDKFLFGQAAAISWGDLQLMGAVTIIAVAVVLTFYKELLVTSFDPGFARATGFPVRLIHDALMLLLSFAVVSALQAVGVVLVSAMLIIPATSAYLLTDRFHRMLMLSALFGVVTGVAGCFLSFLGNNLPTGPLIVLSACTLFGASFLLAPRHGILVRWLRSRARALRVRRENSLKALYHILEGRAGGNTRVSLEELAAKRREPIEAAAREVRTLARHGLAVPEADGQALRLTPEGLRRAAEVVRNHRLWELYLTSHVDIAADHVHEDAEKIEHVLDENAVRELEQRLEFARLDPHGRRIPVPEAPLEAPGNGRQRTLAPERGATHQ